MLKYKSIIENLTMRQKVALLTDFASLSEAGLQRSGVPAVRRASLRSLNEENGGYPTYESAARSWDAELIGCMTEDLSVQARGNGINLLSTPDLKCVANAYAPGLSEDAFLNGTIGAAIARAVHAAGAACGYARLALRDTDIEFLDECEDARAVHELFRKPFLFAAREEPGEVVVGSLTEAGSGYASANEALFKDIASGKFGDVFAVCDGVAPSADFHTFLIGSCIGGAGLTLDRAVGRFEQMSAYRREGSATERELQGALDDGSAIDTAAVDEAVDRVIDFAFRVNRMLPASKRYTSSEKIALQLAQESVVLLKNRAMLPLSAGKRVAVIGQAPEGFAAAMSPVPVVGQARGYVREEDKGDQDIAEAVRLAKLADILIVFLYPEIVGERGRANCLRLPANRLALIDALRHTGKRMIAVLPGDMPADMSFDRYFAATVLAPAGGALCTAALADVLTGRAEPSGRLARTYYDDADALLGAWKSDKSTGKTRVGSFVGYRYYDTAGYKVRYPFGFGLSYTRFAYSGLNVGEEEIQFTVKNIGSRAGCEVAQVYVGGIDMPADAPKKELKAFVRIPLAPGEAKTVTVALPRARMASFDASARTEGIAAGNYMISVGASVSDIRLRGVRFFEGERREKSNARPADYFRDLSNIGKEYRLGTAAGGSRPAKNKPLRFAGWGLLLLALLFIMIGATSVLSATQISGSELGIIIAGLALILVSAILLIAEKRRRNKIFRQEGKLRQELRFESGISTYVTPEEVFLQAFATEKGEASEAAGNADEPKYFDRSQTFAAVCRDLQTFSSERGIFISESDLRSMLAAFAASRLIIVPGGAEKQWNAFGEILAAYFGNRLYAENAEETDLFIFHDRRKKGKTELYKALETSRKERASMHVALLRHIRAEALTELSAVRVFAPAPAEKPVVLPDAEVEPEHLVPPNLWIIAELKEGESLSAIPPEIAEIAAVLAPELNECGATAEKTLVKPLGYYQFANLCKRVRDAYPLDERLWKRVDRLEEKAGQAQSYRFGNRQWIKLEMHISAFLACGGDASAALDSAVAAEVLPRIFGMLCAAGGGDAIAPLEEIFGGEEISCCRRLLRHMKTESQQK